MLLFTSSYYSGCLWKFAYCVSVLSIRLNLFVFGSVRRVEIAFAYDLNLSILRWPCVLTGRYNPVTGWEEFCYVHLLMTLCVDSTLKSLCAAMPFTASVFSSMLVQYSHRHCRSWDCHMRRTWAGRHFVKCEKLMGVVIASLFLKSSYRSFVGLVRTAAPLPVFLEANIRGQPLLWQGVDTGF